MSGKSTNQPARVDLVSAARISGNCAVIGKGRVTDKAYSRQPVVFDPGHPDANAEGYVTMPNVNVVEEMVHMTTSARSFEANASAFQTLKQMMHRAIDMGK